MQWEGMCSGTLHGPQSDGANHRSIISTDFSQPYKKKNSQEKNEQKAQITNSTLLVGKLRLTEIGGFLCKCTVIKWQQSKIFWSQCSVLLATACRLSF